MSAFKTLIPRTISGLVLVVLVVTSVLISKYTFALLLMVVCIGAMREFYLLSEKKGAEPQKNYGITVGALAVAFNFLIAADFLSTVAWVGFISLLAFFFIIFIVELYRKKDNPLANIAVTVTGIMYVALPLSLLAYISMFPNRGIFSPAEILSTDDYKPWVVLCYIFIVWANDVGAYLFGVIFGKKRLFERISPKKSWEGFFGGLVTAIVAGIITALCLHYPLEGYRMVFWIGLAVIAVVSGVFGDLVESMFKRAASVKDSGAIMPGHGGFIDRFDALLFSVPFVYVYFVIFAL